MVWYNCVLFHYNLIYDSELSIMIVRLCQSKLVFDAPLQLYHFWNEGLGVMDKRPSNDHLCIFELLCLFCFSVCHTTHVENYDHWLASRVASATVECCPVISFLDALLQQLGNHILEDIWPVLGVDIGDVWEYAIEVGCCFLLEVFAVEKIGFSACLVLLKKGN